MGEAEGAASSRTETHREGAQALVVCWNRTETLLLAYGWTIYMKEHISVCWHSGGVKENLEAVSKLKHVSRKINHVENSASP